MLIFATMVAHAAWSSCVPRTSATGPGTEPGTHASSGARTGETRVIMASVVLQPPDGAPVRVTVEVARTWPVIQQGLKYRRHLPADHGMLFLMGEEAVHTFWMRDTYVPLDMLFIGRDMRVAGIVARTEPLTDDSRTIGAPSLYVLEVNAGFAERHGVVPGTPVRFDGVAP